MLIRSALAMNNFEDISEKVPAHRSEQEWQSFAAHQQLPLVKVAGALLGRQIKLNMEGLPAQTHGPGNARLIEIDGKTVRRGLNVEVIRYAPRAKPGWSEVQLGPAVFGV